MNRRDNMADNKFRDKNLMSHCVPMSMLQSVLNGKWKILMVYSFL